MDKEILPHNFLIGPVDTDSISFCKQDMSPFTEEEHDILLKEINEISPEFMDWEDDGSYSCVVALKAKNYILQDQEGEITTKGSSIRDQKKEPALREMMTAMIDVMLDDNNHVKHKVIYEKYIKEITSITNIKRWATKKNYSSKVNTSVRTNETKVKDAVQGTDYRVGDKLFLFYKEDDSLCLIENFTGDYNRKRLYKRVQDTVWIFANVLPVEELFLDYSLKKNKKALEDLLNETRSN